jgi:deazaflavin-dependent oxidoreductase (nitroreductase family)
MIALERRRPRLVLASVALAAPGWVSWAVTHQGLSTALVTSVVLAVNVGLTRRFPGLKRRVITVFQRFLLNPVMRALLALGVLPLGVALLETTGRRTGRPRRTPVGEGLEGRTFWIVAEHGRTANYVRNIEADPVVRVKVRARWWPRWVSGTATILDDDDPHARQRQLCRRHPLRAWNAALVRAMGTDLVTIRIDVQTPVS